MWSQRKPSSHVRAEPIEHFIHFIQTDYIICKPTHWFVCLSSHFAWSWSFSWRRNGKYFNVARDSQVSMRRRSGTLDIYAWNNPEQYEAEYQCIASNQYGSAYSNKIRLQLYSRLSHGIIVESAICLYPLMTLDVQWPQCGQWHRSYGQYLLKYNITNKKFPSVFPTLKISFPIIFFKTFSV